MWQIYLHKTVVRFGAGKALCEISTVADAISLPMSDQMIDGRNALQGHAFYSFELERLDGVLEVVQEGVVVVKLAAI